MPHPGLHGLHQANLMAAASAAWNVQSPTRGEVDAARARHEARLDAIHKQVKEGRLGPAVAKEQAAGSVAQLRADTEKVARQHAEKPDPYRRALEATHKARQANKAGASGDALLRELAETQRALLVEQRLANNRDVYLARATPHGSNAPSIPSLMALLESAKVSGDEAAAEFSRRMIEHRLPDSGLLGDDRLRVAAAIVRPGDVNPELVAQFVANGRAVNPLVIDAEIGRLLRDGDATGKAAAVVLAREALAAGRTLSVDVLAALPRLPDATLTYLQQSEAAALDAETRAAGLVIEHAIAEAHAHGLDVTPPSEQELARKAAFERLPVDTPDRASGILGVHVRPAGPPSVTPATGA